MSFYTRINDFIDFLLCRNQEWDPKTDWLQISLAQEKAINAQNKIIALQSAEIGTYRDANQELSNILDTRDLQIEELRDELEEQCRLNGMGSEREARLMAQVIEQQEGRLRANAETIGHLKTIEKLNERLVHLRSCVECMARGFAPLSLRDKHKDLAGALIEHAQGFLTDDDARIKREK